MKDIEPILLGSPDLPDISVSSGCQDEQIYDDCEKQRRHWTAASALPHVYPLHCLHAALEVNQSVASLN